MAARKIARVDFKGKAPQVRDSVCAASSWMRGSAYGCGTASERRRNIFGEGKLDLAGQSLSSLYPEASLLCPPCLSFSRGFSLSTPSLFLAIGLRI